MTELEKVLSCISEFPDGTKFVNTSKLKKIIDKPDIPYKEYAYCLVNNTVPGICPCGNKTKFISFNKGYYKYCSNKCCASNPERRKQAKNTTLEKYGVEYPLQSKEIFEKTKDSLLRNNGVINPAYSQKIQNKRKQTNLEKYGFEEPLSSPIIQEKCKETLFSNYKVYYPFHSEEIKQKIKETNLKRYNVEFPLQNVEIQQKTKQSFIDNGGSVSERGRQSLKSYYDRNGTHVSQSHILNLDNLTSEFLNNNFMKDGKFLLTAACEYFNASVNLFYKNKEKYNIPFKSNSFVQEEVSSWVENVNINDRQFIRPLELDVLSHKHKIAIEYNGLMFHSYGKSKYSMFNNYKNEDKNKHLKKTELVESKGYQLFHIFENENLKIWHSMINAKIGKSKRIYARKCEIKEIDSNTSQSFEDENHIQGKSVSKYRYGLFYKNELVSLMTFGKARFSKKYEYELLRFCNKLNTTVIGGFSKLLKHFEENVKPKSLVSYANRRWSKGDVYEKNNFIFSHNSSPNYFYFKDRNLESRNKYQKHKLKNLLEDFNPDLSESENMYNNDYRRIWDCGNKVYYKEYINK